MAGETVKTEAICLSIAPWSRTSHMVRWLTPSGRVTTSVKGAVRPKSFFLGQYDLNYKCEIVYYSRARDEVHALRECFPVDIREDLRRDYRKLVQAEHYRAVASDLCPSGPEAVQWFELLDSSISKLEETGGGLGGLLEFELSALGLSGLSPEIEARTGAFALRGERKMPISAEVAECLRSPAIEKRRNVLEDAARAVGAFYSFHLDRTPGTRRMLVGISQQTKEGER